MSNPVVNIEYHPEEQSCSWTIDAGFPIKDMIHILELIKVAALNNQLAHLTQQQPQKQPRIIIPDVRVPSKGN